LERESALKGDTYEASNFLLDDHLRARLPCLVTGPDRGRHDVRDEADVTLNKNLALTFPPAEQTAGAVSDVIMDMLPAKSALQVDCGEIPAGFSFSGGAPAETYTEGFLVLQSSGRLNVSAVYTGTDSATGGVSVTSSKWTGSGSDAMLPRSGPFAIALPAIRVTPIPFKSAPLRGRPTRRTVIRRGLATKTLLRVNTGVPVSGVSPHFCW
jgi:hypothetical protein